MSRHYLDLARELLDRQIVDSNHMLCGKVDDVEIEGKETLKVVAILVGNRAASGRLPELAKRLSRGLFGSRLIRIPWSEVDVITHQVKLKSAAADFGLDERRGFAFKIISSLPGSWKK
jgi:sporulation protein YlmC with PRC-barrel domain